MDGGMPVPLGTLQGGVGNRVVGGGGGGGGGGISVCFGPGRVWGGMGGGWGGEGGGMWVVAVS